MKYYYDFYADSIDEHNEYAVISDGNETYIFKHFIGDLDTLKSIVDILHANKIKAHEIVLNKDSEILTEYNNKKYILLKLNSIKEMVNDNFFIVLAEPQFIDIPRLWGDKVNYFIRQIAELSIGKEDLINSFNYYVGMAENAIALYNRSLSLDGEVQYAISHKRIYFPNYALNFYDPTNMIIDIRVRDISEYIKQKFFSSNMSIVEFDSIVSKYNLSHKEINLLYARLFFPTYYFDLFEDNIVSEEDTKKILKFMDKAPEYENFLYKIYEHFKIMNPVFEVEWIKPKDRY